MSDIAGRLRKAAEPGGWGKASQELLIEGATEIETLRMAVYKIQCPENDGKYPHYLDEAEKAAIRRAVVSGLS